MQLGRKLISKTPMRRRRMKMMRKKRKVWWRTRMAAVELRHPRRLGCRSWRSPAIQTMVCD